MDRNDFRHLFPSAFCYAPSPLAQDPSLWPCSGIFPRQVLLNSTCALQMVLQNGHFPFSWLQGVVGVMKGKHLPLTCVFTWAWVGGQVGEGLLGCLVGNAFFSRL